MVNPNLINFQVKNENTTLKERNVMNEFEVANLKQELEKAKSTNQSLSTKIQKLETASAELSNTTTPIVASMLQSNTSIRRGKEPTRKRRKC